MEYIYRMSMMMYLETAADAKECNITVEDYVTSTFSLLGKCIKVEIS